MKNVFHIENFVIIENINKLYCFLSLFNFKGDEYDYVMPRAKSILPR